jgi:hypothetical protein
MHQYHSQFREPVDRGRYQRLLGHLMYLSHTRPDISYGSNHMDVVNRIMQYLKGCPGKGILFSNHGNLNIEG